QIVFSNGKPSSNPSDRADFYEVTCKRFFGSFKFTEIKPSSVASKSSADDVLEHTDNQGDIYPVSADAKRDIGQALLSASAQHKRVLLLFGANWCYDCHVLDRALREGPAGEIVKKSFVLVHVDIGEGDKNLDLVKKYKVTLDNGVPVVAILG